ncbi:hypothetical protein N0B31_20940 [Salinirubellus salinus]|uniref:Uncharacterized protein n=1 Tax=Salinirubellus salinus TaxID=1364945 RepID=A0A9E7R2I4_9EURY|nr:hypothetical protein [Salinirubellus salinus]UWM54576.1 hypothetical protein N0B31_20940 [Salinirubellus salinus]
MNRWLTLLVVGAVLLAGCSFDAGGPTSPTPTPTATGTPTETPHPTATPTPSPPATPTPTSSPTPTPTPAAPGAQLAPGITDDGIENPVALLNAHQRELLAEGFVVEQTITSTYAGEPSNRLVLTTTVGPGGEVAFQNATATGYDSGGNESVITSQVWLNQSTMLSYRVEAGEPSYQVRDRTYPPEWFVWFGSLQRDIQFAADEYEVTDVERVDGVRVVTLEASIDRVANDGVDDTIGLLRVDERGVIRHAETNVTYEEGTTYRTVYDVAELGVAPPAPPAWVDDVPPSASLQLELDIFEFDERGVELVHLYGDSVPANSTVTLTSNGTTYEKTLDEPFGDGSRYLWVDDEGTLRATATPPDEGTVQPLGREVTVTVRAPDGLRLFELSVGRR